MFSSLGWSEILVIIVAGLVILGPERIPETLKSAVITVKKIREYIINTGEQLKNDFGSELETLSQPIAEIKELTRSTSFNLFRSPLLDSVTDANFSVERNQNNSAIPNHDFNLPSLNSNINGASKTEKNNFFDLEAT